MVKTRQNSAGGAGSDRPADYPVRAVGQGRAGALEPAVKPAAVLAGPLRPCSGPRRAPPSWGTHPPGEPIPHLSRRTGRAEVGSTPARWSRSGDRPPAPSPDCWAICPDGRRAHLPEPCPVAPLDFADAYGAALAARER